MQKPLTQTDLARKYRDTHGAKMPARKLARIMYAENKLLFKDAEAARHTLRAIEGKVGKKAKYKVTHAYPERVKNPYNIPDSDAEPYLPYFIKGHKRGLILNDIHIPYHDVEALTAVLDFAKKEKPDFIFVNGDLLDFHQLSYFEKDPKKKSFSTELSIFKQFFEILQKKFKCRIYFKFGNHEERYQKFLWQKAKELDGVPEFELSNIIKARAEGIDVIENKRIVMIGKLPFIHGHETGRGVFNPVNAARGLMLRAKHSAVKGDCHNTSEHATKDILGKFMTTWSVGCLCGLTPQWLPINEWNHGFAMIDLNPAGEYKFRNFRISDGKIL
jgi:predicted phosphodiesterase